MHELTATKVDADMRIPSAPRVEEHQIAQLQLLAPDRAPLPRKTRCRAANVHTRGIAQHVLDKAAAIESGLWRIPSIPVPDANEVQSALSEPLQHGVRRLWGIGRQRHNGAWFFLIHRFGVTRRRQNGKHDSKRRDERRSPAVPRCYSVITVSNSRH
nr:hypothetical protein [Ralstonia sp. UBA689]